MSLWEIFNALPQAVQAVCTGAAGELLAGLAQTAWKAATTKDLAAAYAGIYKRWSEDLPAQDEQVRQAFRDFFGRETTRGELRKVLLDRYREVDFEKLELELRASCRVAGCPPPETELHQLLDTWVRDLQTVLKDSAEYREKYQAPLENAIRELDQRQAVIDNYSLAKVLYRKTVKKLHRYIRFSGMAEIHGRSEVEMERVFVMPRVVRQREYGLERERAPEPIPAYRLLTGRGAKRAVILGAPGSGKTTLCECLALALAAPEALRFDWARGLPSLLPVFYRVRDLDKDLAADPKATIWDAMHQRYSRLVGKSLPAGFFPRMMGAGGLLVLFDGLDEAGSPARRKQIVDLVCGFADDLSSESRVIITSRPHDYQRQRFVPHEYAHFDLCEFNDEEIQTFIRGWRLAHEPDRQAAEEKAAKLWNAIEARPDIKPLAPNALLLTMMVRVHFGLGELPDSRLELYAKCVETLLKSWTEAADLPRGPLDRHQKEKFLGVLAFELQSSHPEEMREEGITLQVGRADLARRLEAFLKAEALREVSTEEVIERLHARDAVLVSYGSDQFGFVHRSFQEYFAAWWMAQRLEEEEFEKLVFDEPPGWYETLCLAVARLDDRRRQRTLVELLLKNRVEFALACVKTAPQIDNWLKTLVQFLSKYTWDGQEYEPLGAEECAEACAARRETIRVLRALFERDNRDGSTLAAAVEMAEVLAGRGNAEAHGLLDGFFAESAGFNLHTTENMIRVDAFLIDKYLVTNREFECMVPAHAKRRDKYSNQDDQPVIYVTWFEAKLYCRWRGPGFRLPTEEEWHKVAAWDPKLKRYREYPWGDEFDAEKCNTSEKGPGRTTPVGAYPDGASAYGCYDMAGNVWEWTATETELSWAKGEKGAVLRGGAWDLAQGLAASASRDDYHPHDRNDSVGFRCARTDD